MFFLYNFAVYCLLFDIQYLDFFIPVLFLYVVVFSISR